MNSQLPPGFLQLDCSTMPFNAMISPIYIRPEKPTSTFGIFANPHLCDENGNLSGGVLATFTDFLLGRSLVMHHDFKRGCLTISLKLDFIRPVPQGSWVQAQTVFGKSSGSICFDSCDVFSNEQVVATASGKFKMVDRRVPRPEILKHPS